MAYIRRHKRSPYWYLKKRNLDTGRWEEESTGLRTDCASDTRKAQRAAEKASVKEKQVGAPGTSPAFRAWVPGYMATHWRKESGSNVRYRAAWSAVRQFLDVHDITYPRQIRYEHAKRYIEWRKQTPVNGKSVGHNTALLELKFLTQLMNEAIRREFAESNPLENARIARVAPKEKREFTKQEVAKLRKAFTKQPEWMGTAFEISLWTGCRFGEAAIPFSQIDLKTNTILMRDSKRDENDPKKFFPVWIRPELRPMLRRLKKSGATVTCELSQDKNGRINKVIRRTLGDGSFHCLRVTLITWLHRAGLSESEAMLQVNHSSSLVHRIYAKLNVSDRRRAAMRVRLPWGPSR